MGIIVWHGFCSTLYKLENNMATYITSDLHFGHKNLINNVRGMSVEENDALLIRNWNNTVKKKDKVFVLGDITQDKPDIIRNIIPQLHGVIEVVLGNHDTPRCTKALVECGCKVSAYVEYKGYILSHIPLDKEQLHKYKGNIHGHIHIAEKYVQPMGPEYINVNCEFFNYTPQRIENFIKE